ncbi:hypothetical protein HY450_03675 [Candidatus Pacearchaeota archaeon]|nr:hypothetical protein [Candidatus Pacearchaeota archaeon]
MTKFKKIVLGLGILIVFMFLLHNGIRAFYKSAPMYDDFCDLKNSVSYPREVKPLPAEQSCTFSQQLREQEQECFSQKGQPIYEYDEYGCEILFKECNFCQLEYNEARNAYNKVVFLIALIVGIITLLVGYSILSVEPVGSALMASGISAIIYGTIVNWQNLGNLGRFLLLLIAFVILIWIALRLNKKKKKSFFERLGFER